MSGGEYLLRKAELKDCGDKGISVGEASTLQIGLVEMIGATIGVSSKDYSKVDVRGGLNQVETCMEARQKQEFGGALISTKNVICDGAVVADRNSTATHQ